MFHIIRNNFRPLDSSPFREYIIKTTNNSIKKDCENYILNKKIYKLFNDSNTNNINNTTLVKYYNNSPIGFCLFTITSFSIFSIFRFIYYYRFKK